MSVLIRPIVNETQTRMTERSNNRIYGFEVELDANKIQIKQEIEQRYDVQVQSVRTSIKPAQLRRRWTRTGIQEGKTKRVKKAFVTITEGKEIDFYNTL